MYALTGANGQLGRLVLQHLLAQVPANQIIATARDPQKLADFAAQGVIVRRADFSDPTTLPAAFEGATSLLIISTDSIGQRVEQHKAAIAGAVVAGVSHIVYTSAPHADSSPSHIVAEHGQTEVVLATSGVKWTALRNSMYADLLKDLIDLSLVNGQLLIPEGSAKHTWITREDCARTAVGALVGKLAAFGAVDVTGPEALSVADLAQRFSSISGQAVTTRVLPYKEIIAQVVAKGVPAQVADFMIGFFSWIAREMATIPTDTVERASGIRPSPVDVILRTLVVA